MNCLTCSSANNCVTCADSYYYNGSTCLICPAFCTSCTSTKCNSCQSGYTPSLNMCFSCRNQMPQCLTCTHALICTQCATAYYFNYNQFNCISCNVTMPNCQFCTGFNGCDQCYYGFYRASMATCSPCNYKINACCQNYVANCSICKSNVTCSICQNLYYLNSYLTCSPCSDYSTSCVLCSSISCFGC